MFGGSKKKSGAANLANLFNNMGASGGVENFANMLNNMGASGGTKLGEMFNQLDSRGTDNYTAFLNSSNAEESKAFSDWIEATREAELVGFCNFLNNPGTSDASRIKQAILQYIGLSSVRREKPTYDAVKSAVVAGRSGDVVKLLNDGFDLASRNSNGEVMLLHAVCMGDARLSISELLIGHGADVNALCNGKTILQFIRDPSYCDNEQTIELLIEHGATEGASRDSRPVGIPLPELSDAELIRFLCPSCNKRLKASVDAASKKATCNKCGFKMLVPGERPKQAPVEESLEYDVIVLDQKPSRQAPVEDPFEFGALAPEKPLRKAPVAAPPDELTIALRELRDSDFDVRVDALAKLRELKNLDAVEPLIAFLKDRDGRMRQETAYTLESLGDTRAVMPLIAALKDLDGDVRLKVARALGVLKDERAIEPLCVHLADPDNIVRFYAAQALGRIGNASALPALRTALKQTKHEEAQRAIEEAIAQLQPKSRTPSWQSALESARSKMG